MKTSPPRTLIRKGQGRSHDLMISDYYMDYGDVGGTSPQDFSTLHDHSNLSSIRSIDGAIYIYIIYIYIYNLYIYNLYIYI